MQTRTTHRIKMRTDLLSKKKREREKSMNQIEIMIDGEVE